MGRFGGTPYDLGNLQISECPETSCRTVLKTVEDGEAEEREASKKRWDFDRCSISYSVYTYVYIYINNYVHGCCTNLL